MNILNDEELFTVLLNFLGDSEYKSVEWNMKMSLIELIYGDKNI